MRRYQCAVTTAMATVFVVATTYCCKFAVATPTPMTMTFSNTNTNTAADADADADAPARQEAMSFVCSEMGVSLSQCHLGVTVFSIFKNGDGFAQSLWRSETSLRDLLARPPSSSSTRFVFAAMTKDDIPEVQALKKRLGALTLTQTLTLNATTDWAPHLVFATQRPVSDYKALTAQLNEWQTISNIAGYTHTHSSTMSFDNDSDEKDAQVSHVQVQVPRLDARYDWLGWSYNVTEKSNNGTKTFPVVYIGDGCSQGLLDGANLTGKVALISRDRDKCSFYEKIKSAAKLNATIAVVYNADKASPLIDMTCTASSNDCSALSIGATMIGFDDGEAIRKLSQVSGQTVNMLFATLPATGLDFALNHRFDMVQTWGGSGFGSNQTDGNPGDAASKLYPSMAFLAWAGAHLEYLQELEGSLHSTHNEGSDESEEVLNIFKDEPIRPHAGNCYGATPFECGPTKVISALSTEDYSQMRVELRLGCNGTDDKACPQWDHIVQLRVCCGDGTGVSVTDSSKICNAQEGYELSRWMTSFGRGVGHWAHDVTPLLPLLQSTKPVATPGMSMCNLTMYSAPWAGNQGAIPWLATLNIRLTKRSSLTASGAQRSRSKQIAPFALYTPWSTVTTETGGIAKVFRWVAFNQTYNSYFSPYSFTIPDEVSNGGDVRIVAVITGHGSDNHQCGEFCATSHKFTVNNNVAHAFTKNQNNPDKNPQLGCAEEAKNGVIPNEYGTWLYGRDGWCNGSPVALWQTEKGSVMQLLNLKKGAKNVLTYEGLYKGSIPDPGPPSTWEQAAPVMLTSVYIVFYK